MDPAMIASGVHLRIGLALLCAVQFMLVLDITVVNVALPSIQADLGLSESGLQWVVSAYALVFGGFLLAGGRAADLLGRRRLYVAGLVVFTVFSLACGLAWSSEVLVGARALQGLGAAMISPAALSILATTFPEGRGRARALGLWGSVGAFGAAAGLLFGGVCVSLLSWHWIFLANVPVGVVALLAAPVVLRESRAERRRTIDWQGATLATGGVVLLVTALTEAGRSGLAAPAALVPALGGIGLIAALVWWLRRARDPLVPRGLLRIGSVAGASVMGFAHGAMMLGTFLLLSLALQQVLGRSAIVAGAGLLAVRGTSILWAQVGARLVTRVGARRVLVAGILAMTAGIASFTRVSPGGSYAADLLPGLLVIGVGIPFLFVSLSSLALAGVPSRDTGVATGLLNTSQWVGGALGIALVSAFLSTTGDGGRLEGARLDELAAGLREGFWACAGLGVLGLATTLVLLHRSRDLPRPTEA